MCATSDELFLRLGGAMHDAAPACRSARGPQLVGIGRVESSVSERTMDDGWVEERGSHDVIM